MPYALWQRCVSNLHPILKSIAGDILMGDNFCLHRHWIWQLVFDALAALFRGPIVDSYIQNVWMKLFTFSLMCCGSNGGIVMIEMAVSLVVNGNQ